ncbi:hypothetical protein N7509_008304 [Penicillium cosmopolitanum]|uniref:Uncharacterized protein n=1 Tax=Penicillium cosmopolitanum TaxID=1131564 RepID=A0A9W9VMB6_9EURO|nr:uncharacterized protein N7509_008304 [Penicillium cosmopolitanum]KAJ5385763.1 hypothetical protein N7509_008304 [Penicillium cosmopolitanum]
MTETSKNENCQINETIVIAAEIGRLDLVTALLENGEDPNTVDETGTSALHNAVKGGYWDVARLLLERNAILRLLDGNNRTPLQLAVLGGHSQIVGLLLECDPSIGDTRDEARETDLHRSLRIAAFLGHLEIVKLLLNHSAPTLSNAGSETALLLAAKKGHHDICEILLKHDMALNRSLWSRITGPSLAVDGKDYTGNSPLAYAIKNGFEKTVDIFLRYYPNLCEARDREKQLLFHTAIRARNIAMTRTFLNHGADVEMKGSYGNRALHEAVQAGSLYYRSSEETAEMIRLLVEHGASATSTNADGRVPEFSTNDPKLRTLLRNYMKTQSKGNSVLPEVVPKTLNPPPEYSLKA